jgi:nucleotide-binding universal stress UspA family protein
MTSILVAYNGGDHSQRALATAAGLARATLAKVAVISVVPLLPDRGRPSVAPWDDEAVHRARLEEADDYLKRSGIEPELIEAVGEPARAIETVVETRGYDMVVIGGGRAGALTRLLAGSVTLHVARHARATVVIVN